MLIYVPLPVCDSTGSSIRNRWPSGLTSLCGKLNAVGKYGPSDSIRCHGHHSPTAAIIQLSALRIPNRLAASISRDLPLPSRTGIWLDVHFSLARLIRRIANPCVRVHSVRNRPVFAPSSSRRGLLFRLYSPPFLCGSFIRNNLPDNPGAACKFPSSSL